MGCDAIMLALGAFNKEIIDCLPYPSDHYEDVKGGTQVLAWICSMRTTSSSNYLAECFQVKLWDFNTHIFRPNTDKIDFVYLEEIVRASGDAPDIGIVKTVELLIKHNFIFIFQPNG